MTRTELRKKFGVHWKKWDKLCNECLSPNDYDPDDPELLKPSGVQRLTWELKRKESEAEDSGVDVDPAVPRWVDMEVIGTLPNKRYVSAFRMDERYRKRTVEIPLRLHDRMRKGLRIRAEVISTESGDVYRHEDFERQRRAR